MKVWFCDYLWWNQQKWDCCNDVSGMEAGNSRRMYSTDEKLRQNPVQRCVCHKYASTGQSVRHGWHRSKGGCLCRRRDAGYFRLAEFPESTDSRRAGDTSFSSGKNSGIVFLRVYVLYAGRRLWRNIFMTICATEKMWWNG